jgi:hypothetical protein
MTRLRLAIAGVDGRGVSTRRGIGLRTPLLASEDRDMPGPTAHRIEPPVVLLAPGSSVRARLAVQFPSKQRRRSEPLFNPSLERRPKVDAR